MKRKKYFVSYSHSNGFGFADITVKGLISNAKVIRKLEREIEVEAGFDKNTLIILFWREFEK